jgi:hypothetical protein
MRLHLEPVHPAIDPYSQTELLNRKFKKIAWSTSLLFLGVIVLLILELVGVIPVSPLQPNIKTGEKSASVPSPVHPSSGPASDSGQR